MDGAADFLLQFVIGSTTIISTDEYSSYYYKYIYFIRILSRGGRVV